MRFLKSPRTFPFLCLAFVFFPFPDAYGQAAVSPDDSTKVISPSPDLFNDIPGESPSQPAKILLALKTCPASIPGKTAIADFHPYAWTSPDGHFNPGPEQNTNSSGSRSNSGRKIRKIPLILGIAGAAVAVAGIAVAADPCGGLGPCFRTGGIIAAGAGGAVAVTGFYFAFKR